MDTQQNMPPELSSLPTVTLVTGHYGVGKTNFSLNLALDQARAGKNVTLIDLDIVNPYFRSSDYPQMLEDAGVRLIAPEFARTALDTPSLSGTIESAIDEARNRQHSMVIVDMGGDDVGATATGRYAQVIQKEDYALLYVVNAFREQTQTPEEAAALLPEIEQNCHLKATALVNNSHLQGETSEETIVAGYRFAQRTARALTLPLACTTVPVDAADLVHSVKNGTLACDSVYFVQVYVRTPWDVD